MRPRARWFWLLGLCTIGFAFFYGCETIPKDVLKLSPESLQKRRLQTREYRDAGEEQILSACSGVLQDLGFTLDESETKLGVITAAKDRNATDAGQVALAVAVDILAAMGGSYSNSYQRTDAVQKMRASVVVRQGKWKKRIFVRVTFQRIVWNRGGGISKMETLDDPVMYQNFFEKLSKSVFLEAHQI